MRGTGTVVRLGIAGQVALGVILASAIAIGITWLSERPGIRLRVDLTAAGENSFHEETLRKLEALPGRPSDPEEHYRLTGDRAWRNLEEEAKRKKKADRKVVRKKEFLLN